MTRTHNGGDDDDWQLFTESTGLTGTRWTPNARTSDPITSHLGAADVEPRALTQRGRLLAAFRAHPDGLTDEEAAILAVGVSYRSCWWKRCSELRDLGLIEPTGEMREGSQGSKRIVCRPVIR